MNNYILISRTYSEITPESAENSDFSDNGFIDECEQVTFRELVDLMRTHYEASCSPDKFDNLHTWYSTGFYTSDYSTATEREECIHFHKDNTVNAAKYWFLAAKIASNKKKPVCC